MKRYTNNTCISLAAAVWLAHDSYDHSTDSNTISVTTLMKPLRQIILGKRVTDSNTVVSDLTDLISSTMGTAFHDSIEKAWLTNPIEALQSLGYPQKVIERIRVNPTQEDLNNKCIPVYVEIRSHKKVGDITISGKFDFIGDGQLEDFKSTGTFSYTSGNNDDKYILQGSLYRWLNPDKVTSDFMGITFIFTDWSALSAVTKKDYPPAKILTKTFSLLSVDEVQRYVESKLREIKMHEDTPEHLLPPCSDADLWRKETVWKYYAKEGQIKSTANFDTFLEAQQRLAEKGSGFVKEVKGKVIACNYCNARNLCSQRTALIESGDLKP